MEIILAWISVALGVAGLAYGIHQNQLKKKIERLSTLQAWEVFQSSHHALGWLNNALKEASPNEKDKILGQARALMGSHYAKTIHNLYTHQPKVTPDLIDRWIEEGRIEEDSRKDFLRLVGETYKV